ncbi:MAG: hypothetical protein RLY21_1823 [Planctomycetota bacterium]|jgi:LysM repeat protein
MALASQSTRPDRPFQSSRSRRSLLGARGLVALCAAGAAFGGSYWLMRGDATDVVEPSPAQSAGALLASSESATLAQIPAALTVQPIAPSPAAQNAPAPTAPPQTAPSATPAASPTTTPTTTPATQPPATPTPSAPVGNGFDGKQLESKPAATAPQAVAAGSVAEGLAIAATDPVKARRMLSEALLSGTLPPMESKQAADALAKIAAQLVFTPVYNASDPYFFQYTVQPGDSLEKIVRKHKIGCDWRLVARINNVKRPEAIRVGQRLKLPKGPFSAVVSKRDYRVDLCMGAGSDRVVMTSLPCGLGSANGTPTGRFRVRPGSKLLNPEWRHPVTGEFFKADDPMNPIGEHWLGIEGIEASNASLAGYGMHGTIEPESIGRDMSLGCVRLVAEDIAIVWETLGDGCEIEIR